MDRLVGRERQTIVTLSRYRRHSRLWDALIEVQEGTIQTVEIPEDKSPTYYRKYARSLAVRWGLNVRTGIITPRGKPKLLILQLRPHRAIGVQP